MEQVTDTEKRRTKAVPQVEATEEATFDWLGLGITIGSWVIQGAAIAAGGALMNRTLKSFTSEDVSTPNRTDGEIIPMRRNVTA